MDKVDGRDLIGDGGESVSLAAAWRETLPELCRAFAAAKPLRHVVIDGLLAPAVAGEAAAAFPMLDAMPKVFREPWAFKGQLSDVQGQWPALWPVIAALHGAAFRDALAAITGVEGLIPDPMLAGAGLHQYPRGGFQEQHVDPNMHPFDKGLHRRINVILYLNPEWREDWGGSFDLWEDRQGRPGACAARVMPRFNRALVFYSSGRSWHSVARVTAPAGITRKSIALYYYTRTRPAEEIYPDSSAIWFSQNPWKRALFPLANFAIARLKPYARHLRPLRGRVFDGAKRR